MRWGWLIFLFSIGFARSQGIITTVAGTDFTFNGEGKQAVTVPLGAIFGMAAGPSGELFLSASTENLIIRIGADNTVKVIAGNGISGFSGEGMPGTSASLNFPLGLALDTSGNLYVADQNNQCVRRISPQGVIDTIAGNPSASDLGDAGPARAASLSYPIALATDSKGNLYITDTGHDRIRVVSADGRIRTIAGNGIRTYSGDGGLAVMASLNNPQGLAVDAAGNIFIADSGNNRIRRIDASGVITTIAGTGDAGFAGDGTPAVGANLNFPMGLALSSSGALLVADSKNNRVRRIETSGLIQTVSGTGQAAFGGDGQPASGASFNQVVNVAMDSSGNILVADFQNYRVRRIASDGSIATLAGNGEARFSGDGGAATLAALDGPQGVSTDSAGNLYIADTVNNRIRKVGLDGIITTIAGRGGAGYCGDDGPATAACLDEPRGSIARDTAGNLYFADTSSSRIRKISPSGIISTLAGNGKADFSGDNGPAASASLNFPVDVDVDSTGNVFIADAANHRIRMVAKNGMITTVAGNGQADFSGDGGSATAASLNFPSGVTVDSAGNLFIADKENRRLREVSGGIIKTIAGNGLPGFSGDGEALSQSIDGPLKAALDGTGAVYVVDYFNARIRKISGGMISTVVGNGGHDYFGDGSAATSASLNDPTSVAVDASGNLFIADSGNNRIRAVLTSSPAFATSVDSIALSAKSGGAPSPTETVRVSSQIVGIGFSVEVSTNSNGNWLRADALQKSMPAILNISADPSALAKGTYQGTVKITAPNANPAVRIILVTLTVDAGQPAELGVEPAGLSFALTQGATPSTQLIRVVNLGVGSLAYSISATTKSGGSWLLANSQNGTTTAGSSPIIAIQADPAGLVPGAYSGTVSVLASGSNTRIDLAVTLTVRAPKQSIVLTQTGLSFTAVAGGGAGPPQSFGIANSGQGVLNWTAKASRLSGNTEWLSVTPLRGTTTPGAIVPSVSANVDAAGLAPGVYYGQVTITAPEADNSPQSLIILLNVLEQGSNPGPVLDPSGLVFIGALGGSNPGSQDVRTYNISSDVISFGAASTTLDGANWLSIAPSNDQITPGQPRRLVVQTKPNEAHLGRGVWRGAVTLIFSDFSIRNVSVLLVLVPGPATSLLPIDQGQAESPSCTPMQLVPVFTNISDQLNTPAAWPVAITVKVVDDCGQSLTAGSVVASFSNGDPPLNMTALGDGSWSATWSARNMRPGKVTISVTARDRAENRGTASVTAGLVTDTDAPLINPNGVVNSVSLDPQIPLAPGSLISIAGNRLTNGQTYSSGADWKPVLGDTSVFLTGTPVLLQSASNGQINAIVPFDLPVNTKQRLLIQRGKLLAVPVDLPMASALPGIFKTGETGSRQGQVYVLTAGGQTTLADPGNPARAGDTILIRCAGLKRQSAGGRTSSQRPATVHRESSLSHDRRTIRPGSFRGLGAW